MSSITASPTKRRNKETLEGGAYKRCIEEEKVIKQVIQIIEHKN